MLARTPARSIALALMALALTLVCASVAIAAPALQLPFPAGQTWWANGPHGDGGGGSGIAYSVDLGPGGGADGTVLAAAAGYARVSNTCSIDIDHGDGWTTRYQHLGVLTGSFPRNVAAGEQIGITKANDHRGVTCNPDSSFSHLHFGLMHGGAGVAISGTSIGGYTVHAGGAAYAGSWTRDADGATVVSTSGNAVCCLRNNGATGPRPDGSFIRTPSNGAIYRIIGGAPVWVSTCNPLGGCPGVVDMPNLDGYGSVPRNGTFMRVADGPYAGLVARVVGGAVLGLATCAPVENCNGVLDIDRGGFDSYANSHPDIANGVFVRVNNGPSEGLIARSAGGHLVGLATCAPVDGCAGVVGVDQAGFDGYQTKHPAIGNGTFVRVNNGPYEGLIARAAGGHLLGLGTCAPVDNCAGLVGVDQVGFESYQAQHPIVANGTFVRVNNGPYEGLIARAAGGHLLGLGTCAPLGGCAGLIGIDRAAFEGYQSKHPAISDGTFVRVANGASATLVTRAAGTALFGLSTCAPLGGCAGFVDVDEASFNSYKSAHPVAVDGTVLRGLPSGQRRRARDGLWEDAGSGTGGVDVNDGTLAALPARPPAAGASSAGSSPAAPAPQVTEAPGVGEPPAVTPATTPAVVQAVSGHHPPSTIARPSAACRRARTQVTRALARVRRAKASLAHARRSRRHSAARRLKSARRALTAAQKTARRRCR